MVALHLSYLICLYLFFYFFTCIFTCGYLFYLSCFNCLSCGGDGEASCWKAGFTSTNYWGFFEKFLESYGKLLNAFSPFQRLYDNWMKIERFKNGKKSWFFGISKDGPAIWKNPMENFQTLFPASRGYMKTKWEWKSSRIGDFFEFFGFFKVGPTTYLE